jgi:alpha-beta hydrolase superfamily lysophospholipase
LKSNKSIEIPGFIYHGDADQITDYQASLAFFRQQTNASWNSWDNGHHESHNDLDQQQVIHSIVQWITELVDQKV